MGAPTKTEPADRFHFDYRHFSPSARFTFLSPILFWSFHPAGWDSRRHSLLRYWIAIGKVENINYLWDWKPKYVKRNGMQKVFLWRFVAEKWCKWDWLRERNKVWNETLSRTRILMYSFDGWRPHAGYSSSHLSDRFHASKDRIIESTSWHGRFRGH